MSERISSLDSEATAELEFEIPQGIPQGRDGGGCSLRAVCEAYAGVDVECPVDLQATGDAAGRNGGAVKRGNKKRM